VICVSTTPSHDESGLAITRRQGLQAAAAVAGAAAISSATAQRAAASPPRASATPHAFGRKESSFDDGWLFSRGDAPGAEAAAFSDAGWRKLDLPHDWGVEDLPGAPLDGGDKTADPSTMAFQTTPPPDGTPTAIGPFDEVNGAGKNNGYTVAGVGWYRKHFTWSKTALAAAERVLLRFDGVYHNSTVWLNGTKIGQHAYGYTPFTVDLTSQLRAGDNVLAVEVDNTVPDSRWYPGYGIYRHTWLSVVQPVHVADDGVFVTTPSVSRAHSTAQVAVEVTNDGTASASARVRVSLYSPQGRMVARGSAQPVTLGASASKTVTLPLAVGTTEVWDPTSPVLYTARTEIVVGKATVDRIDTPFGFRSLDWNAERGLILNGRSLKIRGGCLHATNGPLGALALDRAVERQVDILKSAGFNSIRTAHNPPTPHLLDYCDRVGMLVWDEAFDHWDGYTSPPDYVADLTTFIKRDRNHPSVIIWSTGNEVSDAVFGEKLHDVVHALDASRPAVQGATPFDSAADPQYAYQDVSDVHYDMTDKAAIRAKYPDRPMTQSEAWPATIYEDWKFAQDNAWFVGSWVWAAWDYMGESGAGATITSTTPDDLPVFGNGPYPWFQDYQGDIDFIGQRKPQNYWRSVVYGLSPIELFVERPTPDGSTQYANNWSYYDELQSWTWDVPAAQTMTVHVYTRGDSVTLRLNGTDVATKAVVEADRRVATFQVPYQAGTLTATATSGGRTIGRKTLKTVGSPSALRLTSDVRRLSKSPDSLAHVLVEVLDGRGSLVPDAVERVSFSTSGAGRLFRVANGNPHNLDSFEQPHRYTWHGQALAVVQPANRSGVVRLSASAPGLRGASVEVRVL
jgi:beta-galactosidase